MNIVLVGGGKLVYFLSRSFLSKGYSVTIINKNEKECKRLARKLNVTVIKGDASVPGILRDAGADKADAVISVTPNDEDNMVICQLADIEFNVSHTLAMVNDPDNEGVFRELGITSVFSTTRILSSLIEQRTDFEEIRNLIPASEGKINLTEIVLDSFSPVVGKKIEEVELPEDVQVAYMLRFGRPVEVNDNTVFRVNDRVILVTLPENHEEALKKLTGEGK